MKNGNVVGLVDWIRLESNWSRLESDWGRLESDWSLFRGRRTHRDGIDHVDDRSSQQMPFR